MVRTGATTSYRFEIPDPRGTSSLSLDNTAQTPAWRQFTPYGAPRGSAVTWADNRGYLNKPNDPATGLTYLGARAYDPATATFTSPDPILNPADPQTLNPYAYAADNPVGRADPTGLAPTPDGCAGNITACLYQAYVNGGGQVNTGGTPTGQGYTPPASTGEGSTPGSIVQVSPHFALGSSAKYLSELKSAFNVAYGDSPIALGWTDLPKPLASYYNEPFSSLM